MQLLYINADFDENGLETKIYESIESFVKDRIGIAYSLLELEAFANEDDEDEEEEKEECLEDISTEEREDDAVCNCRRCEERNKKHIEELNATRERPRRRNRYRQ